jgi:uncharacterized membrane protein
VPPSIERSPEGLTLAPVRVVALTRPFGWLALGWHDFVRSFGPSLFHGFIVAIAGLAIVTLGLRVWYVLPGAVTGFVLIAPILATGLYELSRRMLRGERPRLLHAFEAWRRGTRPLVWMGLALAIAGTAWVLASAVLVALFVKAPITGLESFLRYVVLSEGSNLFWLWIGLGGLGASFVFAATAVSVPLMLDRDVDTLSAVLTSVRAVGENPIAMAVWAAIIMALTVFAMATLMLGFAFVVPIVGHATWHAYRDLVDADGLPLRH